MMCEYLVTGYTRRGFIDGVSLRFPNLLFAYGRVDRRLRRVPSLAASRHDPRADEWRQMRHSPWKIANGGIGSVRLVSWFRILFTRPRISRSIAFAKSDRYLNFPGIGVSVQDMMDSLARVGGDDKLALLEIKDEHARRKILYSWHAEFENAKALNRGFVANTEFDQIVKDYVDGLVLLVSGKEIERLGQDFEIVLANAVGIAV